MATGTIGEYRGDAAEPDGASVSPGRPVLVHHLVAKHGDEGLEVLRILLDERGKTLPVFSAGWAARGYLFAEAPGGGWYVKTCTPGELFYPARRALRWRRVGCARPQARLQRGRGGKRHAAGELRGLPVGFDASPCGSQGTTPRLSEVSRMDERTIGSETQAALGEATTLLELAISHSRGSILLDGRTKELARAQMPGSGQAGARPPRGAVRRFGKPACSCER